MRVKLKLGLVLLIIFGISISLALWDREPSVIESSFPESTLKNMDIRPVYIDLDALSKIDVVEDFLQQYVSVVILEQDDSSQIIVTEQAILVTRLLTDLETADAEQFAIQLYGLGEHIDTLSSKYSLTRKELLLVISENIYENSTHYNDEIISTVLQTRYLTLLGNWESSYARSSNSESFVPVVLAHLKVLDELGLSTEFYTQAVDTSSDLNQAINKHKSFVVIDEQEVSLNRNVIDIVKMLLYNKDSIKINIKNGG